MKEICSGNELGTIYKDSESQMPAAKQDTRYDVFISYRRGAAYDLALLLQRELQGHGLAVFLDRDLRQGVFDDKLLRHITDTPIFLVILTPGALDRCSDEEDWLRKEISQAIKSQQNIIPLTVDPFQFTSKLIRDLDPAIRELCRYQAVEYSRTYLESTIERIVKIVAEDKKPDGLRKVLWTVSIVAVVAILTFGLFWLLRNQIHESGPHLPPKQLVAVAAGTVQVNLKDSQNYIWIPPGVFQMGCSEGDSGCDADEKPAHMVKITKGFWLGQTPVTQAAYQRVKGANPSHFHGERLPVESVTWDQARAYCEVVGMRLPTEAEWEYAARAGSTGLRYGDPDAIAWYDGNSGGRTREVGKKQANAWNLHDMLGNVWEWVGDWYDPNYYQKPPSEDPKGPLSGQYRVVRGGSWFDGLGNLEAAGRLKLGPDYRNLNIGFRCVREADSASSTERSEADSKPVELTSASYRAIPRNTDPREIESVKVPVILCAASPGRVCTYVLRDWKNALRSPEHSSASTPATTSIW